jgi:hypothetical protein
MGNFKPTFHSWKIGVEIGVEIVGWKLGKFGSSKGMFHVELVSCSWTIVSSSRLFRNQF